jgi:hypothetical protein
MGRDRSHKGVTSQATSTGAQQQLRSSSRMAAVKIAATLRADVAGVGRSQIHTATLRAQMTAAATHGRMAAT